MTPLEPDLVAAKAFILGAGRLVDRRRFAFHFEAGEAGDVVAAVRAYQNADGGFGNALEPDLRGTHSQPVPLELALALLDEVGDLAAEIVLRACDWLTSVSTASGGVPFVLPSVVEGPHAPWWVATGAASLNPTAGIAGILHKHDVRHAWVRDATEFCWEELAQSMDRLGAHDAASVLVFLEYVPERDRAEAVFARLAERLLGGLVTTDPSAGGDVKTPLALAPEPGRLAGRLFDDATIGAQLDALAAGQQDDGGWPLGWEPPSAAAVEEWRAFVTVESLRVLDAYGRLPPKAGQSSG